MNERASPELRRLRRFLAAADARCPRCRYNLRGTRGEVCPECGLALREEHFAPPPPITRVYRAAQAGAILAAALNVGHAAIYGPRRAAGGAWEAVATLTCAAGLGGATAPDRRPRPSRTSRRCAPVRADSPLSRRTRGDRPRSPRAGLSRPRPPTSRRATRSARRWRSSPCPGWRLPRSNHRPRFPGAP